MGLLGPPCTDAGYRTYSERDAARVAQVVAMRRCGLPLTAIRHICDGGKDDLPPTLRAHLATLERQRRSTEDAVKRTEAAIERVEGMQDMDVEGRFTQMKREGLERFEEEHGREARERHGDDAIEAGNRRMMGLTEDEWDAKELLEKSIKVRLRVAMATGDPAGPEAAEPAAMHRRWIGIHWGEGYDPAAYLGLVRGHLADPRFAAHYGSAAGEGATEFLVRAVETAR